MRRRRIGHQPQREVPLEETTSPVQYEVAPYSADRWTHPGDALVIVIGRGHSGTRAISRQLRESGAFMGLQRNRSEDCPMPFRPLYMAARIAGSMTSFEGLDGEGQPVWDFSRLVEGEIPEEARRHLAEFLEALWVEPQHRIYAWKLPETTFVFPWLVRLYPEARFLHWVRDPRDVILKPHGTDLLSTWGAESPGPQVSSNLWARAYSWLFQLQIVEQTPKPERFLRVRMEDWVLRHAEVSRELSAFTGLGMKLQEVRRGRVGVHAQEGRGLPGRNRAWRLLEPARQRLGYAAEDQ